MADRTEDEETKGPFQLRRLFVKEVSLVGRAANRRRFLLWKNDSGKGGKSMPNQLTDEQNLTLEEGLNTPAEGEEALLKAEALAKMSEEAKNALTGAVRLLSKHKGEMPEGLVEQLMAAMSGNKKAEAKKSDETPEPAGKGEKVAEQVTPEQKPLPAEVLALAKSGDYESVLKAASENPAVVGLMIELLKSRDTEIADLKKFSVEVLAKEDERRALTLVEEMNLPGMAREDQVKFVKSLDPEARTALEGWAKALKAAGVPEAEPTKEIGTGRRGQFDAGSALDEIKKRAKELVQKDASGKTTDADAQLKVLEADSELAARYRQEVTGGR